MRFLHKIGERPHKRENNHAHLIAITHHNKYAEYAHDDVIPNHRFANQEISPLKSKKSKTVSDVDKCFIDPSKQYRTDGLSKHEKSKKYSEYD